MVSCHKNGGIGIELVLLQGSHQLANRRVSRGNRSIVGSVRGTRINEMDPHEHRPLRCATHPGNSFGDNLTGGALNHCWTRITGDRGTETGVVSLEAAVESLCEPIMRVELNRTDKCRCAIALCPQQVWKVGERGRQCATDFTHARC